MDWSLLSTGKSPLHAKGRVGLAKEGLRFCQVTVTLERLVLV